MWQIFSTYSSRIDLLTAYGHQAVFCLIRAVLYRYWDGSFTNELTSSLPGQLQACGNPPMTSWVEDESEDMCVTAFMLIWDQRIRTRAGKRNAVVLQKDQSAGVRARSEVSSRQKKHSPLSLIPSVVTAGVLRISFSSVLFTASSLLTITRYVCKRRRDTQIERLKQRKNDRGQM